MSDGLAAFSPKREVDEEVWRNKNTLQARVSTSCFDAMNDLFGKAENGRSLAHFDNLAVYSDEAAAQEGLVHADGFNGLTIHGQRLVGGGSRYRNLRIGLIRGSELIKERLGFDSVEDGATESTIWLGRVYRGDVTVLNSGIVLPDDSILTSVHRFQTPVSIPRLNQPTASFSQFVESRSSAIHP